MLKQLILFFLILGLLFGTVFLVSSQNKEPAGEVKAAVFDKDALIYFYGQTCPHCQEISKWIKEEKIDKKVKVEKREIYQNQENAKMLDEAAKECKLDPATVGVPFVYASGKCYIGSIEAKQILQKKAGL